MARTSPKAALLQEPPAPVPELSFEERSRLYHETDARIRRDCEEEEKLREEEKKDRQARKEKVEDRQRRSMDLVYSQGASFNLYRDQNLQMIKGGMRDQAEAFLYKDYRKGRTQIRKYGAIQRNFPRAWADEDLDAAGIEVMAVIGDSGMGSLIRYEMWNARKDKGCSSETMEKICDEVKGWVAGMGDDDPVPTENDVALFIDKVLKDLDLDKAPHLLAGQLERSASFVNRFGEHDRQAKIVDHPEVQASLDAFLAVVQPRNWVRVPPVQASVGNSRRAASSESNGAVVSASAGTDKPAVQASGAVVSASACTDKPAATQDPPVPRQAAPSPPPTPQADQRQDPPAVRFAPIFAAIGKQLDQVGRMKVEDTYYFLMRGDDPKEEAPFLSRLYAQLNREPTPVPAALYQEWVDALCQPDRDARGRFALWCHVQPPHYRIRLQWHLQKLCKLNLPPGLLAEMRDTLQTCT